MLKPKVLIIVGPTASGKTSLSIELATKFRGEVISADSRQVYRGLNLGTGKATPEEMRDIPHHLLDIANPQDTYTAHDYVRDGTTALSQIISRGNLPIIAGGTFLYIDSLMGKITFPDVPPNPALRAQLELLDIETLFTRLKSKDPAYADSIDKKNPRRLIRALEVIDSLGHMPKVDVTLPYDTLTLGIQIDTATLHTNIHSRLMTRIEKGMVDEVKQLYIRGLSYARMEDLGLEYRYIARFLQNKITYETMLQEIETKSRQFAKRQMTWLKRDRNIVWVNPYALVETTRIVEKFLV